MYFRNEHVEAQCFSLSCVSIEAKTELSMKKVLENGRLDGK